MHYPYVSIIPILPMFTRKAPAKDSPNGHALREVVTPKKTQSYFNYATKLAVRLDYFAGKGTLPGLASKHGVTYHAVKRWSFKEKWFKRRAEFINRKTKKFEDGEVSAPDAPLVNSGAPSVSATISELEIQKQKIAEMIRAARTGRELRDLMVAQKLVIDTWGYLVGYAKPGTRKQGRKGSSSPAPGFEPLDQGIQAPDEGSNTTGSGVDPVP